MAEFGVIIQGMASTYKKYRLGRIISVLRHHGGKGSGHFGHAGRPGKVGGSLPSGATATALPTKARTFKTLLELIFEKEGFSYQPVRDVHAKSGYMVSPYEERGKVIALAKIKASDIQNFALENADLLTETDKYLGAWWNKENDKVYLDISIRAETKEEAHRVGCDHNQLAYWDIVNAEEITIEC